MNGRPLQRVEGRNAMPIRQLEHASMLKALIFVVAATACVAPRLALAADVAIFTTGAPSPATVRIAVTQRVTWRNLGSSPRAVTAEKEGFPGFALEPEASHSQQFLKVGRYPYQVDGKFDGVVEVTAAGPPSGAGVSPKAERDCSFAVLHYDVPGLRLSPLPDHLQRRVRSRPRRGDENRRMDGGLAGTSCSAWSSATRKGSRASRSLW